MERVELNLHTNMSHMDGVTSIKDYINKAKEYGMTSLAITDHAVVQAFPEAQKYLERIEDKEFKVLYGMEGYYNPTNNINDKSYHINLLTKNRKGLINLYKLVSISNLEYFNKMPRIIKSILEENREGLLIGSSCEQGEVFEAILNHKTDEEIEEIIKVYDYIEIQPIANNYELIKNGIVKDEEELRNINIKIVELGKKYNKLVVVTGNVHFLNKEDEIYRRILQAEQGYAEADNQPPLYFKTTEEMLKEFDYLDKETAYEIVVTNTNKIADICEQIQTISNERCYPYIENSENELKELAFNGAYKIYGNPLSKEVENRLNRELKSIIENNFATLYILAQKLVKKSNEDGYIVSNRGSVGASLVAYCIGITEIDPIKYNIPFETFASFNGDKEPDIDLTFATEYQKIIHHYLKEMFGNNKVFYGGTVGTIWGMAQDMISNYRKNIETINNNFELNPEKLYGIKKVTGMHSGGLIIVPKNKDINDFTPVEQDITGNVKTHFDYHSVNENLLKIDLLAYDVLTILHRLEKLTGVNPKTISLDDEETMNLIKNADTLGISELGTKFVRNLILKTKLNDFEDLVKICGLSHGTNTWKNNAEELFKNGTATLNEVIACRDDIMNYLVEQGVEKEIAFNIMESVRKGKIRGNRENKWKEYKEIMKNHNVPDWYIKSCEKISYLFPRAHSVGYVINSFRIAYYKTHFPNAFYKVYFEIIANIDYNDINNKEKVTTEINQLKEQLRNEENDIDLKNKLEAYEVALEMLEKGITL